MLSAFGSPAEWHRGRASAAERGGEVASQELELGRVQLSQRAPNKGTHIPPPAPPRMTFLSEQREAPPQWCVCVRAIIKRIRVCLCWEMLI